MKTLGIIGGMGPLPTARFYELITLLNPVRYEQEHLNIIINSRPSIPDRTAYFLNSSEPDPVPHIVEAGRALESIGADMLVIPCITSHCFWERISCSINVPLISMAELIRNEISQDTGLLATDGVVRSGLFPEALLPDEETQRKVMELIYGKLKHGDYQADALFEIAGTLFDAGAQRIILGCTELSLLKIKDKRFIDPLELTAKKVLELCK